MKKSLIILGTLAITLANAQDRSEYRGKVGINIDRPAATLDINANPENSKETATTNEGLLIPRLSKTRVKSIASKEKSNGTLVYVKDEVLSSDSDTFIGTGRGFYYYDNIAKKWIKQVNQSDATAMLTSTSSVLNGAIEPPPTTGKLGDFYINTVTSQLFGPKTAGGWGTGTSLVGPAGVVNSTNGIIYTPANQTISLPTATNGQVLKWNGTAWAPSDNTNTNIYSADGNLSGPRTIVMGANNLMFTGTGNIGIGISNPSEKLDVSGNIRTNAVIYNSDARLKTDIKTITNATSTVNGLRSVTYHWNENGKKKGGDDRLQYGFIAQEVEKVLPSLVNTDTQGYKSVNYVAVVPVLVKSIQEKDEEIKSLKSELEQMKKDLEEIKTMLKK